eukprot:TRINITY_DN1309_c0_g2_i1.p1 TRINITY_DN1309_c0_g2~~TRINITY_DN1309_c0_g2_i1.p1  ORF type:complete len:104 (-),score=8.04 TRINITY_DN1309_c0_g2_i1:353-664(-)
MLQHTVHGLERRARQSSGKAVKPLQHLWCVRSLLRTLMGSSDQVFIWSLCQWVVHAERHGWGHRFCLYYLEILSLCLTFFWLRWLLASNTDNQINILSFGLGT